MSNPPMGPGVCKPRQSSSFIVDDNSISILFLPCGVVSFELTDVRDRYCPKCNRLITKSFEPEHRDQDAGRVHRRQAEPPVGG
ncbi:hypothetical protein [Bradyrhizobium sp.]|uniref:hypothetical protein n=1 Tax=Bradyrhizobium sp. TaxID=376 RepID=UPI0026132320|nr:hypothetical protein [Bradyrhizobium sp.]